MSIRQPLLALLDGGDRYGYELHAHFDERTGGAWPLNIGQVYSTLDRMVRDGVVTREDTGDARHVLYALTLAGREELETWWSSPVDRGPGRDDVALKIALAIGAQGVDPVDVIRVQRHSAMQRLQEFNRARRSAGQDDAAWELIADALIFRTEAELRWLDHSEQRLATREVNAKPSAPGRLSTESVPSKQRAR